ncbi:DNA/RNA non-specific endonuclease [Ottowia testudinis]|uniref:DNA/RNA non-specific endonuclease n=1 Tax=Ottowia testudinis TaxID=2816950 RepID=A0A975H357_9BURK|nr:DNA/RNA non-specific endonuclease [Ottowia testudinis]QTD45484.1 DNA/RNA non-specific endonuclease [Ottowia testudinis]
MTFNAITGAGRAASHLPGAAQALSSGARQALDGATQLGALNPARLAEDLAHRPAAERQQLLAEIAPHLPERDQARLVQELGARGHPTDIAGPPQAKPKTADADVGELALDLTQIGLDIAGLIDPTPISDGANGLISLARGDWLGAGISAVSMVPYIGDAAKLGKLGRYAQTVAKAVDLAKANPAIAQRLGPAMEKLREAFGHVALDKLPQSMRQALEPIKTKLDDFARIGVHTVQTTVGKNTVEWTQNAAGETIRAKATLNEVFSGASRSSKEATAQGQAAARGIDDDVGGHIIGHRFVKNQGIRNMFPQNMQFNNSAYRKLENEWADWINKRGGSVDIDIQLVGNSARPDKVQVKYSLIDADGNRVDKFAKIFENQAGQVYDRQYFR